MKKKEEEKIQPEKQKEQEPDLHGELESIYTDKEGNLPDFTRLEGKPTSRLKSIIIGLLLFTSVVAGVTWAGFYLFSRTGGGFTGDGVQLSIISEDSLTAGAETEIVLHYRNKEATPLASSILSADLPDEFVLLSADPMPNDDGEWPIGSVAPNGDGEVRLKGWVRSTIDEALTFQAELNYKPADFSSVFERLASHTVLVEDSVLKLEGSGPEKMTPGDEIELVYTYENLSEQDLENIEFSIVPLEGFLFASAEPAPADEEELVWPIALLEAGGTGTVTIKGTFSSEARGPKSLLGQIGFPHEDRLVSVAEAGAETEVLKSALAVNLIVNGSSESTTASFGEILNFSLNYRNEGDVNLRDVELSAELPSEPGNIFDWVSLKDDLDGKRTGSTITWTKKQIEDLGTLEPEEEGTIDFSVQLIKKPLEDVESTHYAIDSKVAAVIGRVGTISGKREVASTPLTITLNSDTVYKAFARYFTEEGIPLGSGPLPPKVGEKTIYRVFWVIENSLHELTNVSMETILPQGVKWAGTERLVDAGDLSFDSSGRKATWRLNRMPTSVDRLTVTFDVELTPEFEDVGRIVDLTGDNRFEALDKETDSVILITEPPADTSLPADDEAAGKGVVQEN